MKYYAIGGLGADKRVFKYLKLKHELIPLDWIEPLKNESIKNYSIRLSKGIDVSKPFGMLGVSFGGLVAVEISKFIKVQSTILISSAETKKDLRWVYRFIGKIGLIKFIPKNMLIPPRKIAKWLFGAEQYELLYQILNDSNLELVKWSIIQLTSWQNMERLSNPVLRIAGSTDKLIPPKKHSKSHIILAGSHFMIVDSAMEISDIINKNT